MGHQIQRLITILKILPRPSNPVSTSIVFDRITERGFACDKRTVERDLKVLLDLFPQSIKRWESADGNSRTNSWSIKNIRGLLPETLLNDNDIALALALLEKQARSRLPNSVLQKLEPYWLQASETIEKDRETQKWMQDIQYLPDPLRPSAPDINKDVQDVIEDALQSKDALDLKVANLDGESTLEKVFPLRLILQEEILFLLAETAGKEGEEGRVKVIPLHIIFSAQSRFSVNFSDLEPDLAQNFALGLGDTINLVIRAKRDLAEILFHRPIGRQQKSEADPDNPGCYLFSTYIEDSPQLRRWVIRRKGELEVIQPYEMRIIQRH